MQGNRKTNLAGLVALCLLTSVSAFGQDGGKAQTQGMITSRNGDTMMVTGNEGSVNVVLTDDTKTRDARGLFGLEKTHLSSVVLIPGLKVKVKGTFDAKGRIVAKTITTDGDDLESAEMIQAGLQPTAEQVEANVQLLGAHQQDIAANQQGVAANQQAIAGHQEDLAAHHTRIEQNMQDIQTTTQRFTALADYDTKGEATVKFDSGSSKVSTADVEQLKQLAQTAKGLTGYIVEVTGYTDSQGSAVMNTKLSEARAKAVVTVLMQQGGVPVRHIIAPGAMGEYGSAAPNETKAGRADNRRVEVKVLVNKGIAGGDSTP